MSSLSNLIVTLNLTQKYLYRFGCPVLMIIGTIGCINNIIVFTQKTLRKNPCSIYFIAYNIANFLYICASLLAITNSVGYNIDPSGYNLSICHLRLYFTILFNCLSPFYLILASIDRILVTSSNALTRQRSTLRFAFICVIIGTLFWTLFHIHALILTNIIQFGPNITICYFQQGIYLIFIGYYSLIKELATLLLMTIFGLWSIKNVRNMRRVRIADTLSTNRTNGESSMRSTFSKDRQLIFMLLMDIIIYALFSFIFAIYLMYQQITQNYIKTPQQLQIETVIRNILLFIVGIPFCISFYSNLIMSKTFRKEVKKVFLCNRIFCFH